MLGSHEGPPEQEHSLENGIEKHLDDVCFERFEKQYLEDYEHLTHDPAKLKEQKRAFLSNQLENPDLYAAQEHSVNISERIEKLEEFIKYLPELAEDERVEGAYQFKADELLASLKKLKAREHGDDVTFFEMSRELYGEPKKDIYAYTLDQLQQRVENARSSHDTLHLQSAVSLEDSVLSQMQLEYQDLSDIKRLERHMSNQPKEDTNRDLEDRTVLDAVEIQTVFEEKLKDLEIEGWTVAIDQEGRRRNFSVSQEEKLVWIPSDELLQERGRKTTRKNIDILAAHEIGTHVARRENGEKSPLKLLGYGLDRVTAAEEGVATYKEQLLRGDAHFSGFMGYFKAGLVTGVDGKKRDFRELFNIMYYYSLMSDDGKGSDEFRKSKAQHKSWESCIRTFRGTTGQSPGFCHLRDISYREGNIDIWGLVTEHPEIQEYLTIGKYDPTNRRHVRLLQQLNILPRDLEIWGACYDRLTEIDSDDVQ